MKLDLEDIGICINKSLDNNIHMVEKTTQTETFPMSSSLDLDGTPNGTTPCNHPSMSCQVRHRRFLLSDIMPRARKQT